MVKIKFDRADVAVNYAGSDGSPHYHTDASLKVTVIPPKKKFYIPWSKLPLLPTNKKKSINASYHPISFRIQRVKTHINPR